MAQLLCLESMDPDRDISIYINSPGGSFTALTAIYDTMQFIKPDIQTSASARPPRPPRCCSRPAPGKRFALPNARILIHQPYTEGGGPGTDIEIQANEILRCAPCWRRSCASTRGQTTRDPRDKILTAEQAKEYGIVDEIPSARLATSRRG
jgi:ATP-dependent Clp protease protease subunit